MLLVKYIQKSRIQQVNLDRFSRNSKLCSLIAQGQI